MSAKLARRGGWREALRTAWVALVAVGLCAGACTGTPAGPGAGGGTAAGSPAPPAQGSPEASAPGSSAPSAATAPPVPGTVVAAGLPRPVGHWANLPFAWPSSCPAGRATCPLEMDVYAPLGGGPWPLVVVLPGGPADPTQYGYLQALAVPLAARGAVVVTAGWQMRAEDGAGFPQSFEDVACAVGVARGIAATYGASPDRVTLVGHSLGAWAAEVVALSRAPFTPDDLACPAARGSLRPDALVAIDSAPWEAMGTYVGPGYIPSLVGSDRASDPAILAALDPHALLAAPGAPHLPVLLVHGTADTTIPEAYSQQLQAALVANGYASALVLVPGATHSSVLGNGATIDAIARLAGIG